MALSDAHEETLMLLKSDNAAGYFGVSNSQPGSLSPTRRG